MSELLTPDICVIGAGAGGLSAAMSAAAFGVAVVLVEKGAMGGAHLNTGCVPAPALIAAAKAAEQLNAAAAFGLTVPPPEIDFKKVHDHVRGVRTAVAANESAERLGGLGIRVIKGTARFEDNKTVAVGDIKIKARRFIIATGSLPAVPPITGLADIPYLTNETLFDLSACPKHLLIVGAGPIGLEMAQAFRRLGAEVTVFEPAQPLASEDAECAAIVIDQLQREGVAIRAGAEIVEVKRARSRIQLVLRGPDGEEKIEGSHLLVADERTPNIADLDLAAAGIKYERDRIVVDKSLRTTNKKVYAVGDVAGTRYTHVATAQARLVVGNALFRRAVKAKRNEIPRVIYTEPELAQVGSTEAEAKQRGAAIRVLRWPYRENDRAQAERQIHGHIKVITTKRGRILGATIVGAQASELITAWTLAIGQGMNIEKMAELIVPYPTYAEIGKGAAASFFSTALTSSWTRRIMALVRLLG